MKTITTKAELEALSEDAVIMIYEHGVEPNAAVLSVLSSGPLWFTTVDAPSNNGDGYSHEAIWRMYGEHDDGYPRITLIHPLVFDQADVWLAARALAVEDNCIFPDDDTILYVDKARAALGAVGEVEQELREAVTDETPLTLDQYQQQAKATAVYPDDKADQYLIAGLAGEVGELASIFAKHWRGDGDLNPDHARAELGDVLWFITMLADEIGCNLSEVAANNLNKLADRANRGKLKGSGDNR